MSYNNLSLEYQKQLFDLLQQILNINDIDY